MVTVPASMTFSVCLIAPPLSLSVCLKVVFVAAVCILATKASEYPLSHLKSLCLRVQDVSETTHSFLPKRSKDRLVSNCVEFGELARRLGAIVGELSREPASLSS